MKKSTVKNENAQMGRAFKVTITETYQRTITVYESEMKEPTVEEAQRVAEDWWQDARLTWEQKISKAWNSRAGRTVRQMFELISRSPSRYYLAYGSNLDMERWERDALTLSGRHDRYHGLSAPVQKEQDRAATPPSSRMPMKAYRRWSGSSRNTMSSCWTGTRDAQDTITRSSSSFRSGT